MKKMIVGLLVMWAMGTSVVYAQGAKVGDKIKFIMPTIMCDNKVQMAPVYQLQMVMSDNVETFQKKFNSKNNGCMVANTGSNQNAFGIILEKQKDYLSKETTGAKVDLVFEHVKIKITSIDGKDVSDSPASWFTSFEMGPIYKKVK